MSCALKDSQWKTKNGHKEDRNMQSLIPLIFIGLFAYLMFSRKGGGMGCCGGHGTAITTLNDIQMCNPHHRNPFITVSKM
jgi:hypothetical protein